MMNEEDIYAYMFKAKGMTGRMAKKLCKPNVSFEHIFNTDYKSTFLNAFSEGVDDNFTNESDLLKLSKIIENIRKDEKVLREEAKNFYEKLIRENISWTHLNRDDYPEKLKSIIDPPPVIFYKGKLPSNDKPSVAIIGARQCSLQKLTYCWSTGVCTPLPLECIHGPLQKFQTSLEWPIHSLQILE